MERVTQALIAAGGFGSRMDLSRDAPSSKSLIKIHGKTLISMVLASLAESGIRDVVLATHPHSEDGVKSEVRRGPYFRSKEFVRSEHGFRRIPSDARGVLRDRFLFLCGHHALPMEHVSRMLAASESHRYVLTQYPNHLFPFNGTRKLVLKNNIVEYHEDVHRTKNSDYIRNPFIIDASVVDVVEVDSLRKPFSFYVGLRANQTRDYAVIPSSFPPEFDTKEEFELTKKHLSKNL